MQMIGSPPPKQDSPPPADAEPTPDEREEAAANQDFAYLLAFNRPAPPLWTYWLVGANVAAFIGLLALDGGLVDANSTVHLAWGANYGPAVSAGEYWRLFTSMFLHFGVVHLLFNMWALWDLGSLTERLYGRAAFLHVYVAAGLIGSLGSVLYNGDRTISAGASGAIFGLCGALAVFWLFNSSIVPPRVLKRQWTSLAIFAVYSIYMAFSAAGNGLDHAAHIGGLAGGALAGGILMRPLALPFVASLKRHGAALLVSGGAILLLAGNLPAAGQRWPAELSAFQAIDYFAKEDSRLVQHAKTMTEQTPATARLAYAAKVEAELLQPWQAVQARLYEADMPGEGRISLRLQAARDYTDLRVGVYQAYLAGLQRGDRAKFAEAEKLAAGIRPAAERFRKTYEKDQGGRD